MARKLGLLVILLTCCFSISCSQVSSSGTTNNTSVDQESSLANGSVSPTKSAVPTFTIEPVPSSPYRLAYTNTSSNEIYVADLNIDTMRLEGEKLLVGDELGENWYPTVSPDGTTIAFYSTRDGYPQLYFITNGNSNPTVINSSGGSFVVGPPPATKFHQASDEYTLFADLTGGYGAPAWSPDGSKVAYSAYDPNSVSVQQANLEEWVSTRSGNTDIIVTSLQTPGEITNLTNSPYFEGAPSWSPDGQKIAFHTNQDGNWEVYLMNADGSGRTRLTYSSGSSFPSWSPDGSKIIYATSDPYSYAPKNFFIMNADGSGSYELNPGDSWQSRASWSPDGRYIAWPANEDTINDGYEIHIRDMVTAQEFTTHWGHLPSWFPTN